MRAAAYTAEEAAKVLPKMLPKKANEHLGIM
jgi:hypothetical protein